MSATEDLRRMLDERGVEWDYGITGATTTRFSVNGIDLTFTPMRDGLVCSTILTPEQAIAATLGSEDTYTREDVEGAFVSGYSLGLDMFDSSKPDGEKGWNQNERNMDEEMEELGWVRVDAATLGDTDATHERQSGAGTCEADETDTWECVRDDLGNYGKTLTVHVMECTECGHTYEHVNGDYEYCPRCGRKRRDFVE